MQPAFERNWQRFRMAGHSAAASGLHAIRVSQHLYPLSQFRHGQPGKFGQVLLNLPLAVIRKYVQNFFQPFSPEQQRHTGKRDIVRLSLIRTRSFTQLRRHLRTLRQ
jgi:hypothetical protein